MTITDATILRELQRLSDATGRERDELTLEILRNFFWPSYTHPLINEFRWRMDIIGGVDIDAVSCA